MNKQADMPLTGPETHNAKDPSTAVNSSEATESPDKLGPSFLPDSPSRSRGSAFGYRVCCTGIFLAILLLLAVGIALIVIFESLIPKITQKVIDNATLDLQAVTLSNPSDSSFDLVIDAVLVRDKKIPARMHDTELNVYIQSPEVALDADSVGGDASRRLSSRGVRRLQTQTEHTSSEVFLGVLQIPETKMSGYNTTLNIVQQFNFASQEAFDMFTVGLIRNGKSAWHVKGTTTVTVLGKKVTNLKFDKTMAIDGPSFMEPPVDVDRPSLSTKEIVKPKVTGISADPRPDGALDVSVNMTISNPGKTTMHPLGAVLFEISWNGLMLGELETDEISIVPGKNDLELFGVWNLNSLLKGLSMFEMVKVAKMLNELRLMAKDGETILLDAVGVACSTPLYDAAVRAIDATFPLMNLTLDLMGNSGTEEEPASESDGEDMETDSEMMSVDNLPPDTENVVPEDEVDNDAFGSDMALDEPLTNSDLDDETVYEYPPDVPSGNNVETNPVDVGIGDATEFADQDVDVQEMYDGR